MCVNAVTGFWFGLPSQVRDPVLFAIPFFLLLLILEWTAARKLERIEKSSTDTHGRLGCVSRSGCAGRASRWGWSR